MLWYDVKCTLCTNGNDNATAPEQTDFPRRKSIRGLTILPLWRCDSSQGCDSAVVRCDVVTQGCDSSGAAGGFCLTKKYSWSDLLPLWFCEKNVYTPAPVEDEYTGTDYNSVVYNTISVATACFLPFHAFLFFEKIKKRTDSLSRPTMLIFIFCDANFCTTIKMLVFLVYFVKTFAGFSKPRAGYFTLLCRSIYSYPFPLQGSNSEQYNFVSNIAAKNICWRRTTQRITPTPAFILTQQILLLSLYQQLHLKLHQSPWLRTSYLIGSTRKVSRGRLCRQRTSPREIDNLHIKTVVVA